jgi:hypothetical protein
MRQTKSYRILVHDLVSGSNPRLSYSAENLPDSQAFGLLFDRIGYRKTDHGFREFIGQSHCAELRFARNAQTTGGIILATVWML